MEGSGDVRIIIKLRLLNGRPDPGARREMKNDVELFLSKHIRDFRPVAKIAIVHGDVLLNPGNIRALDLRIIKIVKIVEDRDVMSIPE